MSASSIALLVVAVLLVPLAGLFAAMDAALQRVSKARVEELRREGVKRAGTLEEVLEERARYVSLLLLLRIVCETLAAVLVTVLLFDLWGGGWRAVLTAAGIMIVVSYVLVGVGPRTLGRQHAYPVALRSAGLVRLLGRVLGPIATLLILVGNALTPGRGFQGKLSNIDVASDVKITHITIDKNARVQAEIMSAALAIPKSREGSQPKEISQPGESASSPAR